MNNLEGVYIIRNEKDEVIGFVRNDEKERRPIIYTAKEANFQEMQELLK